MCACSACTQSLTEVHAASRYLLLQVAEVAGQAAIKVSHKVTTQKAS